jgi:hypothetical protein
MIFLILLFLVFGAPKSLHAADANAEWQRVVAAAKKEGKVVIGAPPGSDFRNEAQAALKKRFDVDSEFIQAPGPNLMSNYCREAGRRGLRRCFFDRSVHGKLATQSGYVRAAGAGDDFA